MENLIHASDLCRRGVSWKARVQNWTADTCLNAYRLRRDVLTGRYRKGPVKEFRIKERGKVRNIKAPAYKDRVLQRCICDNVLVPAVKESLLYDNSANIKGRGTSHTERRFKLYIRRLYRKYGRQGGILFFDFRNYFGSIEQDRLMGILRNYRIPDLIMGILETSLCDDTGRGIGLGQPASQIAGTLYPNAFDHTVREVDRVMAYGRFMDDGYIILPDMEHLKYLKDRIPVLLSLNGITVNRKKLKIIRFTEHFRYLKKRYYLTASGKLVCRQKRGYVRNEKRRLRKYAGLLLKGRMTFQQILCCYKSFRGTIPKQMKYAAKELDRYFNRLFIQDFLTGENTISYDRRPRLSLE